MSEWGELNAVDQETGIPRALSRKCSTCIYRPGNLMDLAAGRREEMADRAAEEDSAIVCHSTLPPEPEQAICKGYWDVPADRDRSWRMRLLRSWGGPTWVEPPEGS